MERGALRPRGGMLDEMVGARAEGKSLQSVHDRNLLGTNIAPTSSHLGLMTTAPPPTPASSAPL
ncbi:unnamed protein product [Prunus armeniaca]